MKLTGQMPSWTSPNLVGIPGMPRRAIGQSLQSLLLVAAENLLSGFAQDAELLGTYPSSPRRQETERQSARALPSPALDPRHPHLPPQKKRKVQTMCPVRSCVRFEVHPCLKPLTAD